jgi:ELWxxDGT repeat protein
VGSNLLFSADDGTDGFDEELWKSNGTEAGTVRVEDINPTSYSGPPLVRSSYHARDQVPHEARRRRTTRQAALAANGLS